MADYDTIQIDWDGEVNEELLLSVMRFARSRETVDDSAAIDVLITTDAVIYQLNKEYRGIETTTDVLSFEIGRDENEPDDFWVLGQIVISGEQALKQSKELGVSLDEELARLLTHGLLHLVGYDHDEPDSATIMHITTDEILSAVLDTK